MKDRCEHLEECGFFKRFREISEVVEKGWVNLFCQRQVNAKNCARRKFYEEKGVAPPDSLAPNGRTIGA